MQKEKPAPVYMIVHKQNRLITGIVTSQNIPRDTAEYCFIEMSGAVMARYSMLQKLLDHTDINVDELLCSSRRETPQDKRPLRQRLRRPNPYM